MVLRNYNGNGKNIFRRIESINFMQELQFIYDMHIRNRATQHDNMNNGRELNSPKSERLQHRFLMKKHNRERKLSKMEDSILDQQIRMHDLTIRRLENRRQHVRRARGDLWLHYNLLFSHLNAMPQEPVLSI